MRPGALRITAALLVCAAVSACQKVRVRSPSLEPPAPPAAADTLTTLETPPADTLVTLEPERVVPTAHRVRLGVLAPFSGRYGDYGRAYLDGAQIALESYARAGRVYGEALPADTKGAPIAALGATRRLAHEERVLGIVGGMLNIPTWVAAVEANCAAVPFVSNVANEPDISSVGPWVFHDVASQQRAAAAAADFAAFELRRFRVAVLYPSEGEGRALASSFSERIGELGGRIVASESYAPGTMDFSAVVRRIRAAQPELLYVPARPDEVMLIAPTLGFHGVDAMVIGTEEWNTESLLRAVGLDLEGAFLPEATHAGAPGELARFDAAYAERHGERPSSIAVAGYMAMRRVLEVVSTLEDAERDALRAGLEARAGYDTQSVGGFRFRVVRDGEARPLGAP